MEIKRDGETFSITDMDLMEMLTLYIMVSDGAPLLRQGLNLFVEPKKVLKTSEIVSNRITELMLSRTKDQAKMPFLK